MTRISSFGQSQELLTSLLQNQARVSEVQNQISTGMKTQEFSGMAGEAATLLGAKTLQSKNDQYMNTITQIGQQLNMNDLQVNAIDSDAQSLRQAIVEAIGLEQAQALPEALQQALTATANALNTQIGSKYIFAGRRVDTPPVSSDQMAVLLAAPSAANLFQNDNTKAAVPTSDSGATQYGLLASDIGQGVLQSIKNIAAYDAGPSGPLNGKLNAAQLAFLKGELANLDTAIASVRQQASVNGLRQQKVDELKTQLQTSSDFLSGFISDIQDTNITEAVTKMNGDQMALQASYSVVAKLSKLSLLNFL
jgi:flagellar hook-associated protein 3 FlgL